MTDIYDFTEYLKSLKKGFDKEEFKEKISELAEAVDDSGFEYEEFHNLFKVWLNLSIPVTKWVDIGLCLVPRERIQARSVEYALRWLLANYQNQISFSRIAFVLDWLTAAMNCDSIDMAALDTGYEVFYMLLTFELLTPHAMKLVYTLTKPSDVSRWRVLELIKIAKKREAKKSKCRQIQILLGLFKSYKPECVPESIPAFSVHTNFKKLNTCLLGRFGRSQALRNSSSNEKIRLNWVNPMNMKGSKKAEPLIPNLEFCHIGSKQYANKQSQKTLLDFEEPAALLAHSRRHAAARPARLRALLGSEAGLALLASALPAQRAALQHELRHVLDACFLQPSAHSAAERGWLLRRLAALQRTLLAGAPVLTAFLAQFLPFWNEHDHLHEILELVCWLSVQSPAHAAYILRPLGRACLRAAPLARCAILTALTTLYDNLGYLSTRKRHLQAVARPEHHALLMTSLGDFINDLINKSLQIAPDDLRSLGWSLGTARGLARTQLAAPRAAPPPALAAALPLLAPCAALLDDLAALMLMYKQIFTKIRKTTTNREIEDQVWTLQAYTADMISCLWGETVLTERNSGLVFSKLPTKLVEKLKKLVPNPDGALSLRSHIAFAAYRCVQLDGVNLKDADNKMWFDTVVEPQFDNISRFLRKVAPELRG